MDLGAVTHPGYVRTENEDGYFVSCEQAVFAVADGMGGHAHGEVASRLALDAIAQYAATLANAGPGELANALYDAVQAANTLVLSQAEHQDARNRMGTTLVLATICGDRLYFAHIGDSRLYLLRGDVFTQLTRDHSLVQSMVDNGEISVDEAAIHPLRHQITRVVGGENRVSPEIASQALEPGDLILLCSDGLSGAIDAETIKTLLRDSGTAQERSDRLVKAALEAGGPDNITAIVVSYQHPRPIPQPSSSVTTIPQHRQMPRWIVGLFTVLGAAALVTGGAFWHYSHPRYTVSVDAAGTFGLYKTWPLLPMLSRQRQSTPDVPELKLSEAQPYLTQARFQPKSGDMHTGINVPGRDAGVALLQDIINMTNAGLLDKAHTALEHHDILSARVSLDRAKALHADPVMLQSLAYQLQMQSNRRWQQLAPRRGPQSTPAR